ncbi:MAG: 50S ribosomal protein L35 [Planctomycetota bacterium]
MGKKNKTNKSIAKRVKVTAKGKIKIRKAGKSHLLSGKPGNRRRNLRSPVILNSTDTKRLLPLINK